MVVPSRITGTVGLGTGSPLASSMVTQEPSMGVSVTAPLAFWPTTQ